MAEPRKRPPKPAPTASPPPLPSASWRIVWGERSWSENDLTVQHMVVVLMLLSADTWDFDPSKSPLKLLYVLAAFIAVDEQRDVAGVIGELSTVPVLRLLEALQLVDEG